jgi:hypothetical protein
VDPISPVTDFAEDGELPYYRGFYDRLRQNGFGAALSAVGVLGGCEYLGYSWKSRLHATRKLFAETRFCHQKSGTVEQESWEGKEWIWRKAE